MSLRKVAKESVKRQQHHGQATKTDAAMALHAISADIVLDAWMSKSGAGARKPGVGRARPPTTRPPEATLSARFRRVIAASKSRGHLARPTYRLELSSPCQGSLPPRTSTASHHCSGICIVSLFSSRTVEKGQLDPGRSSPARVRQRISPRLLAYQLIATSN